jgi:hypothetical protein
MIREESHKTVPLRSMRPATLVSKHGLSHARDWNARGSQALLL